MVHRFIQCAGEMSINSSKNARVRVKVVRDMGGVGVETLGGMENIVPTDCLVSRAALRVDSTELSKQLRTGRGVGRRVSLRTKMQVMDHSDETKAIGRVP